jgi:hypothetical protein
MKSVISLLFRFGRLSKNQSSGLDFSVNVGLHCTKRIRCLALAAYEDKVVSIEMDKYPEYWDKLS